MRKDLHKRRSRLSSAGFQRITAERLLLAATFAAAATYGCTYLADLGYYTRLGISPDELSVSYATLLPRAVAGLLLPLAIAGPIMVAFGTVTHQRLRRANVRAGALGRPYISDDIQLQSLPVQRTASVAVALRVVAWSVSVGLRTR